MSRDGYLPPGVDYGDLPGYADPDDPTCGECDHPQSDHESGYATSCEHVDGEGDDAEICTCQGFTPPDAY